MVETITPVVHGGRRSRYLLAVTLHALGATLAAAVFGLAVGALGGLLGAPWGAWGLVAVGAVAALYALREAFGLPIPVPDRRRQVPAWWRTFFSPLVSSFLYGLGLGIGFLTFLTYGTFVAVTAAALVTGDPWLGLAVVAPFGFARGVSVAVGAGAAEAGPAGGILDRLDDIKETRGPRLVNALALGAMGAAAAVALA